MALTSGEFKLLMQLYKVLPLVRGGTLIVGTGKPEVTAIDNVEQDTTIKEVVRYNISGQRIQKEEKGVNIIKMSDGTVRKVMVK